MPKKLWVVTAYLDKECQKAWKNWGRREARRRARFDRSISSLSSFIKKLEAKSNGRKRPTKR